MPLAPRGTSHMYNVLHRGMPVPKPFDQPREEAVGAEPSAEEVTQALDKILASHHFQNAEGQKAFLRYAVNETLAGRAGQLKEYTIGVEVFQRKETYDPRYDNTVRIK